MKGINGIGRKRNLPDFSFTKEQHQKNDTPTNEILGNFKIGKTPNSLVSDTLGALESKAYGLKHDNGEQCKKLKGIRKCDWKFSFSIKVEIV